MWIYEKKLEYPVKIKNPNPRMSKYVIAQYGGPDGELAASLRYLSQRICMPTEEAKAILNDIDSIFLRSIISFISLLIFTRILGKKQISQLTLFDYITGITIGSIASSLAVDSQITLAHGLIGLAVWTILPIIVSQITLKNIRLKRFLDGSPTILIQNGKILYENLKKEHFSIVDFLEELRFRRKIICSFKI